MGDYHDRGSFEALVGELLDSPEYSELSTTMRVPAMADLSEGGRLSEDDLDSLLYDEQAVTQEIRIDITSMTAEMPAVQLVELCEEMVL